MILTYKIKHNMNLSIELDKAKLIAQYAIDNRDKLSSKHVKHIGLKSAISNQILRKYGKNYKCKTINKVKLTVPNQGIKVNKQERLINIPCLKLSLTYYHDNTFVKINQIELDNKYAYIACQFSDVPIKQTNNVIGVDLNTTSHCAVASNPSTGKVYKLGRKAHHIHTKYKNMRRKLQKLGKKKRLKVIKKREQNIVKDLNHKISKKIINLASEQNASIKLEDLSGIRKQTNYNKSNNYALNSWSFYQLRAFISYKSTKYGVPIVYIDPAYTSQTCSKCGLIGNRNGKMFQCPHCGHVDHADCNAAFNIALKSENIDRLAVDRDTVKGTTDSPKGAKVNNANQALEPLLFQL